MTFLGNLRKSESASLVQASSEIKSAVTLFLLGLVAILLALGFSYISQIFFVEDHPRIPSWAGAAARIVAVLSATISLAVFAYGARLATNALTVMS